MKTSLNKILLLIGFITLNCYAQDQLNPYKYVIVPEKYDFLKEANQYQVNALSKFLFKKYGFETLMQGDNYPQDLTQNQCLALKSNLVKDPGIFKTKLKIVLTNCNNQVVYTSPTGESREKDYKLAYHEATRKAFDNLKNLNYKYNPQDTKNQKKTTTPNLINNQATAEAEKLPEKLSNTKQTPLNKTTTHLNTQQIQSSQVTNLNVLYAQVVNNGFQLVDSTPKVVYVIQQTSINNVFLVKNESAIIYKQNNEWIYETIINEHIKQKKLHIKF